MFIDIDEAKIKEYVDAAVERKVEALTDEVIRDRVHKELFNRIDGIFSAYTNDIRACVDNHVREIINERVNINQKQFDKAVDRIASSIACRLKNDIIESIAYRLMPEDDDNDD